jgi:hypothetical protein
VSRELEDEADGGPCDDNELEQSLGWTEQEARWGWRAGPPDSDGAELDNCDDEPSLGSVHTHHNQTRWTEGGGRDLEGDEHDGREPDVDDEDGGDKEPALDWSDEEAARGRYPSLMGGE